MTETLQMDEQHAQHGPLEYRAATMTGVSYPDRTIELVVMPYETETLVEHHGRVIREIVARGAFNGIQRRTKKILVNRDHDVSRSLGRVISLQPSRTDGLVAEVKIAKTVEGDETLALADDGILDASAGFRPWTNPQTGERGEEWPETNLRRVTKAWLGHIAMTPDPAYETAQVLSVRQAPEESRGGVVVATPNLDRVRAELLEERYSRLSC